MLSLLFRPALLALLVVAVGYVVYAALFKPRRFPQLPIIGAKDGDWFPLLQATWRNTRDCKSALIEAQTRYRDQTAYLPTPVDGRVLLPASDTQWVAEQPDHILDMHGQVRDSIQSDYTITDPQLVKNPVHHKLISTTLTSQIGNLVPEVAEETAWSFQQHWGADTAAFREVCVYDTVRQMLGSVTNRVFVGHPLCRDKRLLEHGVAYAQDVPLVASVLQLFWPPLRFLLAPFLTLSCRHRTRAFYKVLRPEIERRLRDFDARADAAVSDPEKKTTASTALPPPPNDFLQWSINQAKASNDPYMWRVDTLAGRVLLLNFAAVHTSSFTLTSALFDAATAPPECLDELREEIRTQLAEHGDEDDGSSGAGQPKRWNKRVLAKLEKLDSFLRESVRMNSFITIGLSRLVVAPEGVTSPSGTHLPCGTVIIVPAYTVMHDSAVYPDAEVFQPFRFAEQRQNLDVDYVKRARQAFPSTNPEFLAFGHGKHACPGRFFAANEIKLMLAHAIMNYDIEPLKRKPEGLWFGFNCLPPLRETIRIRNRKPAI